MYKKIFVGFLLIFAMFSKTFAISGCGIGSYSTGSEIISYIPSGTAGSGSWANYIGTPSRDNSSSPNACPRHAYSSSGFNNSIRCCIGGNCDPSYRLWTITLIPCPIDDYIPLLLLATGGLGFIILRKRNLFNMA